MKSTGYRFSKIYKNALELIETAYDWPNTSRNNYSRRDKDRLKYLNTLLTTLFTFTSCAYVTLEGKPVIDVLAASLVGLLTGHFLAGGISELSRKRESHPN